MPVRNVNKINLPESYYHVYARGGAKQKIFLDAEDYRFFTGLFERYLSKEQTTDRLGVPYPHLFERVELLAFCLMQNHFHLLLYQIEESAMQKLMRSIMTSYSRYFNRKYKRSGPVFETRYKASLIQADDYLQHISRYIHLNPRTWRSYRYSSLSVYLRQKAAAEWLRPARILQLFGNDPQVYETFMNDYEDQHAVLENLKNHLADI